MEILNRVLVVVEIELARYVFAYFLSATNLVENLKSQNGHRRRITGYRGIVCICRVSLGIGRDSAHANGNFLARYFFGNRFSNLDRSFDFSSRLIPLSSEPSAFYHNCLSLLSSLHSKHGSLSHDFSCKNLYSLLLDLPSASLRSSGFWAASLKRPINWWAAVWRASRLKLIENKKTDLLWLIIHRAIIVRYALKTWGYKVKSDKCAPSSQVETIEHCFLFCPRMRAVWTYFTHYKFRLSNFPFAVNCSCVFFPFLSRASSPSFSLYCYLIATILFWIWQTRNLATFRNSVLNANQIINLIKKDISCIFYVQNKTQKKTSRLLVILSVRFLMLTLFFFPLLSI